MAESWDGPKFEGPVSIELYFSVDGTAITVAPCDIPKDLGPQLRGDIDNYTKTVMDGLNDVAWGDDIQVVKLTAVKL